MELHGDGVLMVTAFQSNAFQNNAFQIASTPLAPSVPHVEGYQSGSYVAQMTEAEFQRRRKLARYDINDMAFRIFAKKELPELHAELVALNDGQTAEQKRKREMRISAMIDRQIRADHERELVRMADDDEEDELLITYLLN